MVFDHIGFNVSDFAASKDFYLRALAPLGSASWQKVKAGR